MAKTTQFIDLVNGAGIKPSVVYDLGAFDGKQARELSLAWPSAQVISFEADPALAIKCINTNLDKPSIKTFQVAIAARNGHGLFYSAIGRNKECGSLLKPNGKYFEPMPVEPVLVPLRRLDAIIKTGVAPAPDVIWMDVQGGELDALLGLDEYRDGLKMFWAEVAYKPYYQNQKIAAEFHAAVTRMGYTKVFEAPGIPEWFGDVCYKKL